MVGTMRAGSSTSRVQEGFRVCSGYRRHQSATENLASGIRP